MDTNQIADVSNLGRRLALTLGVDPDDGAQEALLIALEVENEPATKAKPLTRKALLGRVHDRLLGRVSGPHGACRGRLDRNQSLFWRGQCSGAGDTGSGGEYGWAQLLQAGAGLP